MHDTSATLYVEKAIRLHLYSADMLFILDGDLFRAWVAIHVVRQDRRRQTRQPGCLQLYQDRTEPDRSWAEKAKTEC